MREYDSRGRRLADLPPWQPWQRHYDNRGWRVEDLPPPPLVKPPRIYDNRGRRLEDLIDQIEEVIEQIYDERGCPIQPSSPPTKLVADVADAKEVRKGTPA